MRIVDALGGLAQSISDHFVDPRTIDVTIKCDTEKDAEGLRRAIVRETVDREDVHKEQLEINGLSVHIKADTEKGHEDFSGLEELEACEDDN